MIMFVKFLLPPVKFWYRTPTVMEENYKSPRIHHSCCLSSPPRPAPAPQARSRDLLRKPTLSCTPESALVLPTAETASKHSSIFSFTKVLKGIKKIGPRKDWLTKWRRRGSGNEWLGNSCFEKESVLGLFSLRSRLSQACPEAKKHNSGISRPQWGKSRASLGGREDSLLGKRCWAVFWKLCSQMVCNSWKRQSKVG